MISITIKQERLSAAILSLLILILLVLVGWLYLKINWEINLVENKLAITNEQLAQIYNNSWQEELERAEIQLDELFQELSFLEDPVLLLYTLQKLANDAGVEISFFKPEEHKPEASQSFVVENMLSSPLEINFYGEWGNVIEFFRLIDQQSPFLLTEELRIVSEGKTAAGMVKILIFYPPAGW